MNLFGGPTYLAKAAADLGNAADLGGLASNFKPMKAGGRVFPDAQSASFGTIGPKYSLMPVHDFQPVSFFDLRNDLPPGRMNF